MNEPRKHELWRRKYVKDAYVDQTGESQWGYIVHERVVVVEVGTFDQEDPYHDGRIEKDVGVVAVEPETGRPFRGRMNMLSGSREWTEGERGDYFERVPWRGKDESTFRKHVFPDGTPVTDTLLQDPA